MKMHCKSPDGGSCITLTISEDAIYEATKDIPMDAGAWPLTDAIMSYVISHGEIHEPTATCPKAGSMAVTLEDVPK